MQWYYIDQGGNQSGPLSTDELKLAMAGVADYYVFQEGFTDWCLASQIAELTIPSCLQPPPLPDGYWRNEPIPQAQDDGSYAPKPPIMVGVSKVGERLGLGGSKPQKRELAESKAKREAAFLEDLKRKFLDNITRLQGRDLKCDEVERVRDHFESLLEDLLDACDKRIENLIKEGEKAERLNDIKSFMSLFGRDGDWGDMYKKPTRSQVEEVLNELERVKPGSYISEMDFLDCLKVKFPGLRK